jgi:hypothetical protein
MFEVPLIDKNLLLVNSCNFLHSSFFWTVGKDIIRFIPLFPKIPFEQVSE